MTADADSLATARAALADARQADEATVMLQGKVDEAQRRYLSLQSQLRGEERDVDRLEGISLSRVIAALSGHRQDTVERQRAERDAVALRLRTEYAVSHKLERDLAAAQARAAGLPDAERAYEQALADREASLSPSDPMLDQIHDIENTLTAIAQRRRETEEARDASATARAALEHLLERLDSASNWSTWDMLGGGLVSTMVKHERLDEAGSAAAQAQAALDKLGAELADIDEPAFAMPDIAPGQRFVDAWFDNIFTDVSVNRKINDSRNAVAGALSRIVATSARLSEEMDELDRRGRLARDRRRAILDPGRPPDPR